LINGNCEGSTFHERKKGLSVKSAMLRSSPAWDGRDPFWALQNVAAYFPKKRQKVSTRKTSNTGGLFHRLPQSLPRARACPWQRLPQTRGCSRAAPVGRPRGCPRSCAAPLGRSTGALQRSVPAVGAPAGRFPGALLGRPTGAPHSDARVERYIGSLGAACGAALEQGRGAASGASFGAADGAVRLCCWFFECSLFGVFDTFWENMPGRFVVLRDVNFWSAQKGSRKQQDSWKCKISFFFRRSA
jgi:hypothetical protein